MTHSVERRKDQVRRAVIRCVEIVGDGYLLEHDFLPDDPRFADILPTTWRELVDAGLAKNRFRDVGLTPAGWLTGLRLSGRLESPEVRSRATALVRALKARIKGRHDINDEFVDVRELAAELQIPQGWLTNALEANLLQKVFKKDRMNARLDSSHPSLVRIPPTFNSDPIDVD